MSMMFAQAGQKKAKKAHTRGLIDTVRQTLYVIGLTGALMICPHARAIGRVLERFERLRHSIFEPTYVIGSRKTSNFVCCIS